jgi:type 1 fimbria pilin
MKSLHSFAIAIPLAATLLFAQSNSRRTAGQADIGGTHTYTGIIVDSNCSQANALTGNIFSNCSKTLGTFDNGMI